MHITRSAFVLALTLASAGCFSSDPTNGPNDNGPVAATVQMTDQLRFSPASVTIHVGESVRWDNVSQFTHTVTADPAKAADPAHVSLPAGAQTFDSGGITPGTQFEKTFTVPGTYHYFCQPHEALGMLGTVTVLQ